MNIKTPTDIQNKTIGLAMEGKDIMAQGKTGTGKTLAYAIPVVQRLAEVNSLEGSVLAAIFVPTKDLAEQVASVLSGLLIYFHDASVQNLARDGLSPTTMPLAQKTILVATPLAILGWLKFNPKLLSQSVKMIVVDEADVIFSERKGSLLEKAAFFFPTAFQTFITTATLNMETERINQLFFKEGVKVVSATASESVLKEYLVGYKKGDKMALLYALVTGRYIKGRFLIFTNTIEEAFRVWLFLHSFGLKVGLVNPEMPLSTRIKTTCDFNNGLYDHVVLPDPGDQEEKSLCRGIDFHNVQVVLNFTPPDTTTDYIHRIGRTARGGKTGTAVTMLEDARKRKKTIFDKMDIEVLDCNLAWLEALRYRINDMTNRLTRARIENTRRELLQKEILQAGELQAHFARNTDDAEMLSKGCGYEPKVLVGRAAPEYLTMRHLQNSQVQDSKEEERN